MTQKTKWLDLLINGDTRKAETSRIDDQYVVMVPAANLVDASGSGQHTPTVQGHRATFDKNGVLLGVDALGWNAEEGFYNTKWPSKTDSIYNANAAKNYAPQVFQQLKKHGGYLSKFDIGGVVQQPESDKQKRMKELLLIINGAAKELSTKQPGDNVAYLAQVMQDPQEAALIDAIIAEIPDAQEIIDQVSLLSSQMFKCGGKTKKKVKKGAKGCVPCKKLMKIGGKLINVWADCEGRIIHKNSKGGWIVKAEKGIPGGFAYGNLNLLTFDDISKTTGQADESKYYIDPTTNQLMKTTWNATTNKWDAGQSTTDDITAGIGDGQVNLWKEGYNPETGLFTGETVTYTDKLGIKGKGYTTRAVENNNLVTINGSGSAQFSSVQGTETPYKNISYMPKAWRVNRALRDKRRELYYKDLLNGASVEDAKANKKIQKSIDKNFVYGRDLSEEAAAAVSVHNSKNPNEQIYTVSPTGISYKDLRKANNASASTNLSSTLIVQPELNNGTTGTAYVNPTKIRAAYRSKGGWLTKFLDGGHMDYETKSNISGTTWEQRIDRDNTGAIYRYNPGRTSHVVTLQTTGLPAINPTRFVKYGEERYYLTDPKTGRVMKIEGPTIDQRVEEEAPIVHSSIIEDHITPEQDIFIFPGGFTKVIPTPVQKPAPKKSKKPAKPEKKAEGPKQEVPTQPNDNTSTSGSKTPGNIRQGNYPVLEPVPVPEGYNPSNEWVEERDLVNGQVRVTWRNKKTGEISRIKPFKYGGWLTKFN